MNMFIMVIGKARLDNVHDLTSKTAFPHRFIPFSSWPSLLLSMFALHNETGQSAHQVAYDVLIFSLSSQYPLAPLTLCIDYPRSCMAEHDHSNSLPPLQPLRNPPPPLIPSSPSSTPVFSARGGRSDSQIPILWGRCDMLGLLLALALVVRLLRHLGTRKRRSY